MRPLFLLDGTAANHPSVKLWFNNQPSDLGAIARRWFDELRNCGDDVEEVLHDDQPTACVDGAAFAYVAAFAAHVNVGFFQGADLPDPGKLLEGTGTFMRHVKIKPGTSLNTADLSALIRIAYADVKKRLAAKRA
jgi:hypothetical protein